MVLPGGYNLLFLILFLRREEWDFGEYDIYINEGKFDEFYVKKEKFKISKFKISYDMLKKGSKFLQFNPYKHLTGVESTRFFNRPYLPGWAESTLF